MQQCPQGRLLMLASDALADQSRESAVAYDWGSQVSLRRLHRKRLLQPADGVEECALPEHAEAHVHALLAARGEGWLGEQPPPGRPPCDTPSTQLGRHLTAAIICRIKGNRFVAQRGLLQHQSALQRRSDGLLQAGNCKAHGVR